jgi:hypothetical protein
MLSALRNPETGRVTSLPAWLMSLILHLALVVLLALLVPRATRPSPQEPDRDVGIVLAHTGDRDQSDYTDKDDAARADSDRAEPDTAAGAEDLARQALPAMPNPSSLLIPEIELPGSDLPSGVATDLLVPNLTPKRRGGKPTLPGSDDELILAEQAARQAARAALGPATEVSVFGSAPAVGRSFVFAIDRSKSMGGDGLNALSAAREELMRALSHLVPKHKFQIVAYHHGCVYFNTARLVPATEENKRKIAGFIDGLAAFGGTDHEMALRASLAMEPDAVFLLNDGGDPHLDEIQLKNIKKLAGGRSAIHCIQFGFGPQGEKTGFMTQLTRDNNGSYTYVDMSARGRKGR